MSLATVERPDTLRALNATADAANLRAALLKIAAVSNRTYSLVRLSAAGGRLEATTTNGKGMYATAEASVSVAAASGPVGVSLRLLRRALAGVKGAVSLTCSGERLVVDDGAGGTVGLPDVPCDDDFKDHPLPKGRTWRLEPEQIAAMVAAADHDDYRPIIAGVCFGPGFMVATDSYRVHAIETPDVPDYPEMIVPAAALRWLARLSEPAEITVSGRTAVISGAGQRWRVPLTEGDYPNWRVLFENLPPWGYEWTFGRDELLSALRRVIRFADYPTPVVIRTLDGLYHSVLTVTNGEVVAEAKVGVSFEGGVPPIPLAFNPRYLAETVAVGTGETVTLRASDQMRPVTITDESDVRRLLMPVRRA